MKIVSLIPSATEIISALNLCNDLVGISHECDYPKEISKLPKLTTSRIKTKESSLKIDYNIKEILEKSLSVYEVKSDLLKKLDPDVIITQSQCSVCAVSLKDVEECCEIISDSSVVGFDTETKPAFKKGVHHDVSLLQLSANNNIFLFRVNKIGLPKMVIDILSSKDITKVGIDIKNDISGLKKIKFFHELNFIDLNTLALKSGFKSIGAVKLSIMLLGYRISKKQRLSDWAADELTVQQIDYAAIDAWICPQILNVFKDRSLYP